MLRRPGIRAFSTFARQQLNARSGAKHFPNGTSYTVHRVQFKNPPFFTLRRMAKVLTYALPIYFLFDYVLPVALDIEIEDDEAETVGEDGIADIERNNERGDDNEEDEEDGLFIPLGWPKLQPRRYYRGSDPEWQEFLKLAKDPKRNKEIQSRLVSAIRDEVAGHPQAPMVLGQIDRTKGRWWVDTTFPDGPPQEYAVKGIEITDEYVYWSTKEMSSQEYHKLRRSIFPTAAVHSSLASMRYLFEVQVNKVREYFGLPPRWNQQVENLHKAIQVREAIAKAKRGRQERMTPAQPPASSPRSADPSQLKDSSQSSENSQKTESSSSTKTDQKNIGLPGLPSLTPSPDKKPIALMLFMQTMSKNTPQTQLEPPNGAIVLSGVVEVIGSRGRATLAVVASYDPKKNEFHEWRWQPWRMQPRTQHPKGGP